MRIAYLGYDFLYSCLEYLSSHNQFEIIKVFSNKTDNHYKFNEKVKDIAAKLNLTVQLERISLSDLNELQAMGCELIISAAYPYRIPINQDLSIKAINIHPTLLPEGKGPWPLPYIILKDFNESGVTIHKLAKTFDSGDILIQEKFEVSDRDDLETLSIKSQIMAVKILSKLLTNLDFYWQNATPQTGGSYWKMPTQKDKMLDWTLDVKSIERIQRAFGKFDSFAIFDDIRWAVQDLNFWHGKHDFQPGTVVHRTNKEILIAAKDGYVCLRSFKKHSDYNVNVIKKRLKRIIAFVKLALDIGEGGPLKRKL